MNQMLNYPKDLNNMTTDKILLENIETALRAVENRKYRIANDAFRFIYEAVHQNPLLLWNHSRVYLLGRVFLVMYHRDLFDSEEQNVELAHLSLVYLQRSEDLYKSKHITDLETHFETLRIQAVLLKTCEDCFVENVSLFYQPHSREVSPDEKNGSFRLASRVMVYVLYSILVEITDTFDGFKNDLFLDETCKYIELENPSISDKLLKEGSNVRQMLYTFSKAKIANKEFHF